VKSYKGGWGRSIKIY